MKIVQSIWSKPSEEFGGHAHYHGRWPHPRDYWFSWVLSTGWALRHYGQVELVTDTVGAKWAVDTLKVPFTSVRIDLNNLQAPARLWAAGKIVAYAVQSEPFFHLDGDVYLAGRLPAEYESAQVLCQVLEHPGNLPNFKGVYDDCRQSIESEVPNRPTFWRFMNERVAGNCGIFGGTNLDAISRYARAVLDMLHDPVNLPGWHRIRLKGGSSCVIEQQALCCSMREQDVPLTTLFADEDFQSPSTLRAKATYLRFNHAAVEGKNPRFGSELGQVVAREFPEQHRIIQDLYPRQFAELGMPSTIAAEPAEGSSGGSDKITQVELLDPDRQRGAS